MFISVRIRKKDKKEKSLTQGPMRKEELRKVGYCFIRGCFIKPFQMITNHFLYFSSSFAMQFLIFDIRSIKRGTRNGK